MTNGIYSFSPVCKKQPPSSMQAADTRETIIVITLTSVPIADPDLTKIKSHTNPSNYDGKMKNLEFCSTEESSNRLASVANDCMSTGYFSTSFLNKKL